MGWFSRQSSQGLSIPNDLTMSRELAKLRDAARNTVGEQNLPIANSEAAMALSYFGFVAWFLTATFGPDPTSFFGDVSGSAREEGLSVMRSVIQHRKLVMAIKHEYPAFDPKSEIRLGEMKANNEQWTASITRQIVIGTRFLAFSYCHANGLPMGPVGLWFGLTFSALSPQQAVKLMKEWMDLVFGESVVELLGGISG